MISKIVIVVDHTNLYNLLEIIDYYKNSNLYKDAKISFAVHELLEQENIIQGIVNQKVFCNENNVYSKITEILKDEKSGMLTFQNFVLGDFDLQKNVCYFKKDISSYGILIGNNNFWNKIYKIINIVTSSFEMIKNFNSSFLFLKIIENFYEDTIDLTNIAECKNQNNLIVVCKK